MLNEWQKRRSELNHGRLGNEFRTELGNVVSVLKGNARWPGSMGDLISACVDKWQTISEDAQSVVESFEKEMSPRRYFELPPLCNCDSETTAWLPDLIHDLWLSRHPVSTWMSNARVALTAANSACETMNSLTPGANPPDKGELQAIIASAVGFQDACDSLVERISKFPSTILL